MYSLSSAVHFLEMVSLVFRLRWNAFVGGFGNSCCTLLSFMLSQPLVGTFLKPLGWELYLVLYTNGTSLLLGKFLKEVIALETSWKHCLFPSRSYPFSIS